MHWLYLVLASSGTNDNFPSNVLSQVDNLVKEEIKTNSIDIFQPNKDCIQCICEQESGCRAIGCNMDEGSLSCGYFQAGHDYCITTNGTLFQIKLPYYIDCGQPGKRDGESSETAWKRCADDYNCALTCLNNFVARYSSLCPNKGGCERISRLHNGGPNGCNAPRTDVYWDHIRNCCACN